MYIPYGVYCNQQRTGPVSSSAVDSQILVPDPTHLCGLLHFFKKILIILSSTIRSDPGIRLNNDDIQIRHVAKTIITINIFSGKV